jgi:hypothetical protein
MRRLLVRKDNSMKLKRILIALLVISMIGVAYSAIGTGSITSEAKRGWGWFLNVDPQWATLEPALIVYLESEGLKLNTERINADSTRKANIAIIRGSLRDATGAQIAAMLTALGL